MGILTPLKSVVELSGRTVAQSALLDGVTATGAGTAQTASGEALLVTVDGGGTFTIVMEGSKDGTNWYTLDVYALPGFANAASITAEGAYEVDVSGWTSVRANCTANDGTAVTVS